MGESWIRRWRKGGKRKVKRKKRRKLLAAVLAAAMLVPQSVVTAGAADLEPVFTHEAEATVNSGTGAVTADATVVETIAASEDVTVNLTFTTTNSALQVLFYMGDNTVANNYASVYLQDHTLGIEHRNQSGTQHIEQLEDRTYTIDSSVDLSEQHTLTFVMDGGSHYSFYLDGEEVKRSDVTCDFNTNLMSSNYIGFGNGSRSSGNTYPFTGTISKIELYNTALSEEDILAYHNGGLSDVVYSYNSAYYPSSTPSENTYVTVSDISEIKALEQGSITVRYRVAEVFNDPQMLLALSDSSENDEYLGLYIQPSTNVVGLDAKGGSSAFSGKKIDLNNGGKNYPRSISDTNWHTITVTKDESVLSFYIDGAYIDRYSGLANGFLSLVSDPNTLGIGKAARSSMDNMELSGAIDSVKIYSSVLTAEEVARDHAATQWTAEPELDMENAYKSETIDLFYPGYKNSQYRIPSLLTTQEGTQLAFIDERNSGTQDAGNIDAVVRRKEAGETQFADSVTLIDLPNNGGSAAFTIDMATVQEQESGRIFAFVDMFPESSGLMNTNLIQPGVGYKKVDGADCQILYTNPEEKEEYGYISDVEDGIGHVLDNNGEDTGYTVIVYPYAAGVSLQEKGNLYKDGEYRGNIYMKSGPDAGELRVLNTSYLWLVTSDDDGKTWSDPVDITPQVKPEWCVFFGTGPGVGIQLHTGDHEGRLVVPVYTANKNVGSSQSSAVIYSDDNGQTWHLGESPQTVKGNDRATMNSGGMLTESQAVQLDNGDVLLFMRTNCSGSKVYVAVSKDGGATWASADTIEIKENYCQLSVIHYTKADGTEWVLLSNASGNGRMNGRMYLGQVQADGSISWDYNREINGADEKFAYSCLTLTDSAADPANPKFAIMYEDDTDGSMRLKYFEFDENYLKAGTVTPEEMDAPQLVSHDVQIRGEGTAEIALTFDQVIMAAGEPQLTLTMGSEEITADYVSGSGTDTVVFTAAVPEGTVGILRLTGLDLENGMLENIQGMSPTLTAMDLFANTEIDLAGAEVTYTTQHSSSTAENTDGAAVNVIDGNPKTYWHSTWGSEEISLPQSVTLELPEEKTIYKVDYLARQNSSSGRVKEYGIEVSTDNVQYTEVAHGMLADSAAWQGIEFIPAAAKYIRFVAYEAYNSGTESCSLAELKLHEYSDGVITPGNKEELKALADGAADLAEEDYSDVTWSAYAEALAAANAVLDSEIPVSQSLIDRTADNLKDAQEALTDISRAAARFDEIRKQEAEYTPDSWAAFEAWMNENEPKLQDAVSSREVTDLIAALVFQEGQLVIKADKDTLNSLYTQYTETEPLTEDGYDQESWAAYEAALEKAKTLLDDENALQTDVDAAVTELTTARTDLKADITELQMLYDSYAAEYTADKESEYLPDAWMTMQQALTEAKALLDQEAAGNDKATPAEVKEAINALNEAKEALDAAKRADTTQLKAVYDEVSGLDLDLYADPGVTEMQEALDAAKAIIDDPQPDSDVQGAIDALKSAYNGLILKTTMESFQSLYDELKGLDLNTYMSEGAKAAADALRSTEAVLADPQTEADVQDAIKELQAAKDLLVLKATEEQILAITGLEESLGHKDLTGLSDAQLAQVKEIRDALLEAINADEISAEYAAELIEKAEAAMSLSGQEDKPQTPSEGKPSGGKPSASDDSAADGDKAVQTGDTASFGWIILLMAAGAVTAAAVCVNGRKSRRR